MHADRRGGENSPLDCLTQVLLHSGPVKSHCREHQGQQWSQRTLSDGTEQF